jgi:hypothetical protein
MSTEMVGREATLERGGRSGVGVSVEGVDEWARSRFERLGRWGGREGKKEGGGGGSSRGSATWRGTASWGLARTGGRRAGTDVGGPQWQQERGGASGARARVGQPEKKMGQPSPDEQYGFAII